MIPQKIIKNRREYIFVEEYPNFLLYKNAQTGTKASFKWDEINDVTPQNYQGEDHLKYQMIIGGHANDN